jgi:hypothetical protein
MSNNIYNNMLCAVAYTLKRVYGFGSKRIERFVDDYNRIVQDTLDLDYLGEHYVTLEDYAVELNSEFGLGLDIEKIAICQYEYDVKSKEYHDTAAFKGIINLLRINGYKQSADFLENYMEKETKDYAKG